MGQTVDQIEDHIESSREDLRSNLEELDRKLSPLSIGVRDFVPIRRPPSQLHSAAA